MSKVSGIDALPAEIFKAAGPKTLNMSHIILTSISEEEIKPNHFCDVIIVMLLKTKGNKADCGNYSGISLSSTAGKILA